MTAHTADSLDVRAAVAADIDALRDLHAASWRHAYAASVPAQALGAALDRHMAARWATLPTGVVCAVAGRRIVGFARVDRRGGWPYVDNLHVAPDLHRRGAGVALMRAVADVVAGEGRVWLTVVAANTGARAFYAALGGHEGAPITETLLGHPVTTRPVIWLRLAPILARGAARHRKSLAQLRQALDAPDPRP